MKLIERSEAIGTEPMCGEVPGEPAMTWVGDLLPRSLGKDTVVSWSIRGNLGLNDMLRN